MNITSSIDIAVSPDIVFSWLSKPERAKVWMRSVVDTKIINEADNIIGTTFREVIEENGRRYEMHGSVTGYSKNEMMSFHLTGKYNTTEVKFTLTETQDGTRLTQFASVRFLGIMKIAAYIFTPHIKKNILKQSQKEFLKLKELCEK